MTVAVAFPPPLDMGASLELFRRSGDDLIDRWDGCTLTRVLRSGERWLPFTATPEGSPGAPILGVHSTDPAVLDSAARTFFLPPPEYAALLDSDSVLCTLESRFPGVRQVRQLDPFTALVRCISAQQVNLRWAATTRRRLAERFGTRHEVDGQTVYSLDPRRIASVAPAEIRALQFTTSKAEAIVAVARALVERPDLSDLDALPDEEVVARLTSIRGIGRWSAEWVLARTLGRPTVVAGDLGVRKAVGRAYLGQPLPPEPAVRAATAHWGQSAGIAQALLLHGLVEGAL